MADGVLTPVQTVALVAVAAASGQVESLNTMGVMFASGIGVAQEDHVAARCFGKAAEKSAQGKYNLALMLKDGRGVPQDTDRATSLLKEAQAEGSLWTAQVTLFLAFVMCVAATRQSEAQATLEGFGLPLPPSIAASPQPSAHTLQESQSLEGGPPSAALSYLARVRIVDQFLRTRFGFGFGDAPTEVLKNAKGDLNIQIAGGGASGEGNWQIDSSTDESIELSFRRGRLSFVELLVFGGTDDVDPEQVREQSEYAASREILRTTGLSRFPRHDSSVFAQVFYSDPRDPCGLELITPEREQSTGGPMGWAYALTKLGKCDFQP